MLLSPSIISGLQHPLQHDLPTTYTTICIDTSSLHSTLPPHIPHCPLSITPTLSINLPSNNTHAFQNFTILIITFYVTRLLSTFKSITDFVTISLLSCLTLSLLRLVPLKGFKKEDNKTFQIKSNS